MTYQSAKRTDNDPTRHVDFGQWRCLAMPESYTVLEKKRHLENVRQKRTCGTYHTWRHN